MASAPQSFAPRAHRLGRPAPPLMRTTYSVSNGPVESSAVAPAAAAASAAKKKSVPKNSPAAAAIRGRGPRRWRRIRREQEPQRQGHAAAAGGGGAGVEDSKFKQFHKRLLPFPASPPPNGRHGAPVVEAESSTASVQSRFVPLDPDLVSSAGFSIGAGGAESNNSDDRGSRPSTAASASRNGHASLFQRERDTRRTRLPGGGTNPRAARSRADRLRVAYGAAVSSEADHSLSSVESNLWSSNALKLKARQLGAGLSGVRKVFSDDINHSGEEVESKGHCKENGSSVVGRSVQISADSGNGVEAAFDEASVGNGQNGRVHSGPDRYNESTLLLLQRTQEALENEIEKIMAIGKEPTDDFDVHDDEWSGSVHLEEPIDEVNERIKHIECRLEEATALIREKTSRMHEMEVTATRNTNLLLPQSELDQLYQDKMEAEVQNTILTRAYQASITLPDDQMALYKAQKSLSEDYKQLGLKLRLTENRAMVLEEIADKLQAQCKELYNSSEILQLQSKASRASLFCFLQFILLCIAIGTYLMRISPSSTEVVPT